MAQSSAGILIPETAFKDVTIISCVFGATARTAIRFHKGQQHINDESLLSASLCLVAATLTLYLSALPLYHFMIAEAAEKANTGLRQEIAIDSLTEAVLKIENYFYPFGALIWGVAVVVKFCYLHFFRFLTERQKPLENCTC